MYKVKSQPFAFAQGKQSKVKNQKSKIFEVLLITLSFYFLLFSFDFPLFAQDKIVAIVNNEVITQKDLNDFLNFMRVQFEAKYSREDVEQRILSMKSDLLDRLIEDRLIVQEAKSSKIEVDKARIEGRIEEMKKGYASEREFRDNMMQNGLVQADLESKIRDQILMFSIIDTKVKQSITVSPAEVAEYFQKNNADFIVPEQREFQTVSSENEQVIKAIAAALSRGDDFAATAKAQGLTLNSMNVYKGKELAASVEEVVFALTTGEYSKPLKIADRFYIFKLTAIAPPQSQKLADVQEELRTFLYNSKLEESLAVWIKELRKKAYIKVMDK